MEWNNLLTECFEIPRVTPTGSFKRFYCILCSDNQKTGRQNQVIALKSSMSMRHNNNCAV